MTDSSPSRGRRMTYAAPALEKGLDILELLAHAGRPMTTRQIADELGRSKNEIFRMVHVLIGRGYLGREGDSDGLTLTNKLFTLGIQTPGLRDLVSVATPEISALAEEIRHSIHLVVANRGETVVIASASGNTDFNFSLKLGYRRPLVEAHSGMLLLAFQPDGIRDQMIAEGLVMSRGDIDIVGLRSQLESIRKEGAIVADSRDIVGVTDIAAPIVLSNGRAIATAIVSYVNRREVTPNFGLVVKRLKSTCQAISASMEE